MIGNDLDSKLLVKSERLMNLAIISEAQSFRRYRWGIGSSSNGLSGYWEESLGGVTLLFQ